MAKKSFLRIILDLVLLFGLIKMKSKNHNACSVEKYSVMKI